MKEKEKKLRGEKFDEEENYEKWYVETEEYKKKKREEEERVRREEERIRQEKEEQKRKHNDELKEIAKKTNLFVEETNQLETWTGLLCNEILFDSKKDNWSLNTNLFQSSTSFELMRKGHQILDNLLPLI